MAIPKAQRIRPDWWSKSLAGGLLGLLLAFALVGLFAWLGPGGINAPDKVQFNMWIISPIWLTLFSLTYLFRSGRDAWAYLGSATLMAGICLAATRWLSEGG